MTEQTIDVTTALHNLFDDHEYPPYEEVVRLLEQGAEVNKPDEDNYTFLHKAIASENEELVQLFLDYGADIHVTIEEGQGLLHFSTFTTENLNIITMLVRHGCDVDQREDEFQMTSLHTAAFSSSNPEICNTLIDCGADVNAYAAEKKTALHICVAENNNPEIVETLIKRGADVNALDTNDQTPLHIAVRYSNTASVIRALIDNNADTCIQDIRQRIPQDYAKMRKGFPDDLLQSLECRQARPAASTTATKKRKSKKR